MLQRTCTLVRLLQYSQVRSVCNFRLAHGVLQPPQRLLLAVPLPQVGDQPPHQDVALLATRLLVAQVRDRLLRPAAAVSIATRVTVLVTRKDRG